MPVLANYPVYKQAAENSCWACAARSIVNFNFGNPKETFASDQELAKAYATKAKKPAYADINVQRSAADALTLLGIQTGADSEPFLTADEIKGEMDKNRPVLSIVGTTNPGGKRDLKYTAGHWVVIVGISDDKKTISVFDPANGKIGTVPYNAATYAQGVYWENSSYVGAP